VVRGRHADTVQVLVFYSVAAEIRVS